MNSPTAKSPSSSPRASDFQATYTDMIGQMQRTIRAYVLHEVNTQLSVLIEKIESTLDDYKWEIKDEISLEIENKI